ncbi:hypothetical protein OA44_20015 [Enterobacter cloacae]|nr:hypothetical protein OA44_20015 [Enterobacter cloacae]
MANLLLTAIAVLVSRKISLSVSDNGTKGPFHGVFILSQGGTTIKAQKPLFLNLLLVPIHLVETIFKSMEIKKVNHQVLHQQDASL